MTPYVTDDVVLRVIELADMDENPLDIDDPVVRGSDAMETAVQAALTGLDASAADRVEQALTRLLSARTDPTCDIDMITAALLVHEGVDPLTVAWLSAACNGLEVTDDDDMDTIISVDADIRPHESMLCETVTRIGDHAWWKAGGVLMLNDMPDTTITAASGRKLRDILSHPVLDTYDITVENVEPERDGVPAHLECHLPAMAATPAWLNGCMPRERRA